MGTTARQGASELGRTGANSSHGRAVSPRQCCIVAADCDSCCRGFESHQPPQSKPRHSYAPRYDSCSALTIHPAQCSYGIPTAGIRRALLSPSRAHAHTPSIDLRQYENSLAYWSSEQAGCTIRLSAVARLIDTPSLSRAVRSGRFLHRLSPRGIACVPPGNVQSLTAFSFPPSGRELAKQMGECRRRTHRSDALYSQARRANFQAVSHEQSCKVMVGLALRNRGALEITKPDAQRAVVLTGMAEWEHHPMGLCYDRKRRKDE